MPTTNQCAKDTTSLLWQHNCELLSAITTNDKPTDMTKKSLFLLCMLTSLSASAQQVTERLGCAPVAVNTKNGILVSWRSLTSDSEETAFTIRRGNKVIAKNVSSATNYLDKKGNTTDTYTITTTVNGKQTEVCSVAPWQSIFTTIDIKRPPQQAAADGNMGYYQPEDISVGDLDGDGEYELVLKWGASNQRDNGHQGCSSPCIIDAYRMDGTHLWRIDLGLNIRSGAHYTQFLVYDFDGDGKAEMICKTAPGSKDGTGHYVSEAGSEASVRNADNTAVHVNRNGHITGGEEFLTVFNGLTGKAMHTIFYSPSRSAEDFPMSATEYNYEAWGDHNYNRGNRHNAAVAYLNGTDHLPSAIMQRGYYTRCYLWAVDWNGQQLSTRWLHKGLRNGWSVVAGPESGMIKQNISETAVPDTQTSFAQGVHSISVADVDGDGCDEISIGAATIDHNGSLLFSTGAGHGDAIHLTDLCPDRPGYEVMMPHEEPPYGYDIHDAATGEIICSATGHEDNGRGLAANFLPSNPGSEFWSATDRRIRSCSTGEVLMDNCPDINFRIYWTGDPYDQTFDGRFSYSRRHSSPRICNYNTATNSIQTFFEFLPYGNPSTCNGTKSTPCLQADILGDWREEIIMYRNVGSPHSDSCQLMIFSTPEPTIYKVPCLMQDHVYRMGIAWQNSSYNQPPHLSYDLPSRLKIDGKNYKTQNKNNAPVPPVL